MDTQREATERLAELLDAHGLPKAVSMMSSRERRLVPLAERSAMYATARRTVAATPTETIAGWCASNIYAVMTVAEIAAATKTTGAQVRAFIADQPSRFMRREGRTWEVRS
jgi:hypothetical protein